MMPTADVATNSARIRPLTARNPAFGLSPSRRAAISVASRLVRRAISRAPIMVSHGPAITSPAVITRKPDRYAYTWWMLPCWRGGR